jgi:hypothetical protein
MMNYLFKRLNTALSGQIMPATAGHGSGVWTTTAFFMAQFVAAARSYDTSCLNTTSHHRFWVEELRFTSS